jgi:hypothetical protein
MRSVVALAGLLLLAGCLEGSDADLAPEAADGVPPGPGEVAAQGAPAQETVEWGIAFGAGAAGYSFRPSGESVAFFKVPADTALLVADSAWTCATGPACSVRVTLFQGETGTDAVAEATGAGTSHIEVPEPRAGTWRVIVYPGDEGSAVAQVVGTSTLTFSPAAGAEA